MNAIDTHKSHTSKPSDINPIKASKHPSPPTQAADHELLSHKDAEASIPKDDPVAGEEDPGAAIEEFVALGKTQNH